MWNSDRVRTNNQLGHPSTSPSRSPQTHQFTYLQRLIPLVNKLMLRARGHNDNIALLNLLILTIDRRQTAARCEEQDLVDEMDLWEQRPS
ncbi:hypothetical protein HBH98_181070 [Parastagonospora nodorum]|nr:hypothetical protein HBH54_016330 [Parastagonospora nodorum]KAH3990434.1 hypothetical protein HBH52_005250 [Parastagonospora nodorum]KAH4074812.1 hypothetical protein HBH50_030180 [Parastagonospora nodorum]KAH4096872.1 hypothetical protein HBH48_039060 [Parastagonospora nodorum]KAH4173137.1 hypothetical protein HBH44_016790 [Parastagonospora nodorum]